MPPALRGRICAVLGLEPAQELDAPRLRSSGTFLRDAAEPVAEAGADAKPGACGGGANSTLSTTADLVGSSICDQAAITIMMCAALPVTRVWITSAWSSAAVFGWPASLARRT